MGMSHRDIDLLIHLRKAGYIPDRASVVEIGAQQLSNSVLREELLVAELGRVFGEQSVPPLPPPLSPTAGSDGAEQMSARAPWARGLWTWLGFSYAAIDIDGSPDSIPLDLNFDDVPGALVGRHQVVTNFGTTEHIANQLNAFKVIHDLTAPGGVMIHNLPSQGGFNHGLVNYTPKFFWMLARSNDYRWLYFDFHADPSTHPMPDNLVEAVQAFRPEISQSAKTYRVAECSIMAAFQKRGDAGYVPPIDVPTGTVTGNKALLRRYASVLKGAS